MASQRDPSLMTVVQLKQELTNRNVTFKNKETKQYYVELLRNQGSQPSLTGFSSDEDEDLGKRKRGRSASQSRRRSSIGRRPQAEVVHSTDIDVDSLSDVDLRRELVSRGEHPGPITKLTRSLYERQLRTLLGQGDEKKRGRTSKTQSLPSTPQRGVRAFEMSGDEADGKPTPSVTRSPARATPRATPRRRLSELERLRMESPGPKSVLAMEPTGVASDAPVTRRASQRFRQDNTAKAAGAVMTTSSASSCSGGVNKMSAWGGLIAVTLLVVFTYLLFNGFLMKIPSKR